MSAYCRALGKILLAYLDETQKTPNTITDLDELLHHLRPVREQGFAVDLEETKIGCICEAAPIIDGLRPVEGCHERRWYHG